MNWFANWDFSYVVQQTAILSLYPVVPLLVIAAFGRRRNLLAWCGCAYIATFAMTLVDILSSAFGFFGVTPPYTPFRIGPSLHSILDLLHVFILSLWLPSLTILGGLMVVVKIRRKEAAIPIAMLGITAYFAVAGSIWTVFLFHTCGFTHEDTVWAAGYDDRAWGRVEPGMARQEVVGLLGRPLKAEPRSVGGSEVLVWSDFHHTGYRAQVVFEGGKAVFVERPLQFHRNMD